MDELEISGKRYISSRRAAKENNYTSDYIGQLIRGKKVIGQKVGRSWYVSEESLTAYFRGESVSTLAEVPVVAVPQEAPIPQKIEEPAAVHIAPKIEELKVAEPITETPVPISIVREERKSSGLTYMSDDSPLLPEVSKSSEEKVIPIRIENASEEKIVYEKISTTRTSTRSTPALALVSLALLTFALVSALSYFFMYTTTVDGEHIISAVTFGGFK